MLHIVQLKINEKIWSGWQSMNLKRSMEEFTTSFRLGIIADNIEGMSSMFQPNNECKVLIDGEVVLNGWIDEVSGERSSGSISLTVSGRDKLSDLVDSSAVYDTAKGQWLKAQLSEIINDLLAPFKIPLAFANGVQEGAPIEKFQIASGETVLQTITRACGRRQILPLSDGSGTLLLSKPSAEKIDHPLIAGKNIRQISTSENYRNRFSKYVLKHQKNNPQFTDAEAKEHMKNTGIATDPSLQQRHRPMLSIARNGDDVKALNDRAKFEANMRAAKSRTVQIQVAGFRNKTGSLWKPNTIVYVKDKAFNLDGPLRITSVSFDLTTGGGSITTLQLMIPEAMDKEADIKTQTPGQGITGSSN